MQVGSQANVAKPVAIVIFLIVVGAGFALVAIQNLPWLLLFPQNDKPVSQVFLLFPDANKSKPLLVGLLLQYQTKQTNGTLVAGKSFKLTVTGNIYSTSTMNITAVGLYFDRLLNWNKTDVPNLVITGGEVWITPQKNTVRATTAYIYGFFPLQGDYRIGVRLNYTTGSIRMSHSQLYDEFSYHVEPSVFVTEQEINKVNVLLTIGLFFFGEVELGKTVAGQLAKIREIRYENRHSKASAYPANP